MTTVRQIQTLNYICLGIRTLPFNGISCAITAWVCSSGERRPWNDIRTSTSSWFLEDLAGLKPDCSLTCFWVSCSTSKLHLPSFFSSPNRSSLPPCSCKLLFVQLYSNNRVDIYREATAGFLKGNSHKVLHTSKTFSFKHPHPPQHTHPHTHTKRSKLAMRLLWLHARVFPSEPWGGATAVVRDLKTLESITTHCHRLTDIYIKTAKG